VSGNQARQHDRDDRLTALITGHQRCLYLYICSLVHRTDDATDVLQETNLVLWREAQKSLEASEFRPWAYRVAYHQVLAYRKRRARDRLLFDESLVQQLAKDAEAPMEQVNAYQEALRLCSRKLPPQKRRILAMRYTSALSVRAISQQLGSSVTAVSQSLRRIRVTLLNCIRDALADDALRDKERL
jgi:RNA polymerase sigma-70 factor, ECF subfamily